MSIKITSPIKGFSESSTFGPLTLSFKDGVAEVEELPKPLRDWFERKGYTVEDGDAEPVEPEGPFDPAKHKVEEVQAYLEGLPDEDAEAHDAEVRRVVEAEKAGKNRKSLLEVLEGTPEGQGGGDGQ